MKKENEQEYPLMKYAIPDRKYRFVSFFDMKTGMYLRTGILDSNGTDTGVDPFMASFPHLIDVGIMGHCIHGKKGLCIQAGVGCYQSGMLLGNENMDVEDFLEIAQQCKGRTNQIALGGRGDPDQHEHFETILKICRSHYLVPNFTTSGYGMTSEIASLCKKYCGAVAVSWYRSDYTLRAIRMLLDAGVKTNIHYVLAKNTIDEAIERLRTNDFPQGINSVVFLLHKPVGQGKEENRLAVDDSRVKEFYSLVETPHPFKVGLDSCSVPGAVQFCTNIMMEALDTCEAGRYSCYIDAQMNMMPCSFDQSRKHGISLKHCTIEEAWNSDRFEVFRKYMYNSCPSCEKYELCKGGCPLMPEIVFCQRKERKKRKDTDEI